MTPSSLIDALLRANSEPDESRRPRPLPEAVAMRLREALALYQEPNPFKPGDLIQPRPGYWLKMEFAPMIVIDVREATIADRIEAYKPASGCKPTIRVAYVDDDGNILYVWVEHAGFEPYTGAGHDAV